MLDLAITGASVVTPGATKFADVGIKDGKIASISTPGKLAQATDTIDARGMILLPGAVDPHTHLDAEMFGATTADDFESGTIAAAGGSLSEAISKWDDKARGRAIIDYGFHVAILDPTPALIAEIPQVVERGV